MVCGRFLSLSHTFPTQKIFHARRFPPAFMLPAISLFVILQNFVILQIFEREEANILLTRAARRPM